MVGETFRTIDASARKRRVAGKKQSLGLQRLRLRAALRSGRLIGEDAEACAVHAAAVNRSLAVMSRAGESPSQLLAIVGVTVDAVRSESRPAASSR